MPIVGFGSGGNIVRVGEKPKPKTFGGKTLSGRIVKSKEFLPRANRFSSKFNDDADWMPDNESSNDEEDKVEEIKEELNNLQDDDKSEVFESVTKSANPKKNATKAKKKSKKILKRSKGNKTLRDVEDDSYNQDSAEEIIEVSPDRNHDPGARTVLVFDSNDANHCSQQNPKMHQLDKK